MDIDHRCPDALDHFDDGSPPRIEWPGEKYGSKDSEDAAKNDTVDYSCPGRPRDPVQGHGVFNLDRSKRGKCRVSYSIALKSSSTKARPRLKVD